MIQRTEHFGAEYLAQTDQVIECDIGKMLPGKHLRVTGFSKRGGASFVMLGALLDKLGVYVMLTPDGARMVAEHLLWLAAKADARNAALASVMLDEAKAKGPRA
jgi:hypothetical protein